MPVNYGEFLRILNLAKFLLGFIPMYISVTKMAVQWVLSSYLAFIRFVFTCAARSLNESNVRIFLHNTNPAKTIRRTFLRRNSQTKNRSENMMAAPQASVHLGQSCLSHAFAEGCSQIRS